MLDWSITRALLCAALLALGSSAALAQGAAPDPAGVAAAKDLMEVVGTTKQIDGMIRVMGEGFRKGVEQKSGSTAADAAGKEFDRFMDRFMSYRQAMLDEIAALYAGRFTAEELKTIADFYRSGTGAKFIEAAPELMQAGGQIGMRYAQKVMQETQQAPGAKQ